MFQGQGMPYPPPGGATYPYPQYGAGGQGTGMPFGQPGYPGQAGYPGMPPAGFGYPGQPGSSAGQPNMGYQYGQPKPEDNYTVNQMPHSDVPNDWAGFADKTIRQAFVRKVYSILSAQLLFTCGMIGLFIFCQPVKEFIQAHRALYFVSYVIFLSFYLVLVCCQSVARKHPVNIIMLFLLTVSMSYMAGTVSTYYNIEAVFLAAGITAACCIAVTLLATCTKFDITSCAGVLFIVSWVFFLGGILFFCFARGDSRRTFQLVYSCIGALLFMFYLAYETQLIFGGRKYEYSPEDYVVATIQLYIDIVNIFMLILSIIGGSKN